MKTKKLLSAFLLSIAVFASQLAIGQEKVAKTFQKDFTLTAKSNIYIENRFGQVNIENWDKNNLSITIEVKTNMMSNDKIEKLIKSVNIEFSQSGDKISAITKIDESFIKSWNHLFDDDSKDFSIDWEVKMPKNINLELLNKYGDIFINELTGHCKIDIKYGNLKANRIYCDNADPITSLSVGYGNATIDEVNWFKADIKYGKLNIVNAKAIVLISKYSKIAIDQASSIVSESKYDSYSIGTISNFVGEGGYTTYRFDELTKKFDLTAKYGDVKIKKVPANFESIKFNGGYTSILAGIDPSASYMLTAEIGYGNLRYNNQNRLSRIEGNTSIEADGLVGTDANTKSKVSVIVRYGSARFE